jgi:hypothetical protein
MEDKDVDEAELVKRMCNFSRGLNKAQFKRVVREMADAAY